jgi:hypothetical protein
MVKLHHGQFIVWSRKVAVHHHLSIIFQLVKTIIYDDVDDADIVSRLPSPRVHRGLYKFDFDFSNFEVE